jgi:hypothetical protein
MELRWLYENTHELTVGVLQYSSIELDENNNSKLVWKNVPVVELETVKTIQSDPCPDRDWHRSLDN